MGREGGGRKQDLAVMNYELEYYKMPLDKKSP